MHGKAFATFLTALALAGCASALKTAEQAAGVAGSSTARTAAGIAGAHDPKAALREIVKERKETYARNPTAVVQDVQTLKRDYDRLMDLLSGNVRKSWGKKEVKLPSRTHYVKYTQNYKSRAEVDFDGGIVTVETVDEADPQKSLRSAIVTTLLTPSDPRSVDLFSDSAITLTGDSRPYLLDLVVDHRGRPVATPPDAEAFAEQLWQTARATRAVELETGTRRATYVRIRMVANFAHKQAETYRPVVERYARQYRVSPSLVFAVIRTESNFNPYAVSSAPAYGMMQLVPTSGGREATRKVKGVDEIPSRETLFDPERNIELGTAYLGVLGQEQLQRVAHDTAREYCVISAYNTGPANVLRSFARDQVDALNAINGMQPPGVYQHLRAHLPHEETRQYLVKVVGHRKQFVRPGE